MMMIMTDYIFINKKGINSALNSVAYFSFEVVSSDHMILSAKSHQILHRNKNKHLKLHNMTDPQSPICCISYQYMVTVRNKFGTQQETSERRSK